MSHTAPEWQPDRPDLDEWGVTEEEARALLRRQMCPACGEGPWVSPLTHAAKRHGIDKFTMREVCGLNTVEPVTDPDYRAQISAREQNRGRDMQALSQRPRKKYRTTSAGKSALTKNLANVTNEQRRAAAQTSKTPDAIARQAASLKANWDDLTDEQRSQRTAHLKRTPEQLSEQSRAAWAKRGLKGHGTRASYRRGCRCEGCREAYLVYKREHG